MVRLKKTARTTASNLKHHVHNENAISMKLVSNGFYPPGPILANVAQAAAETVVTGSMLKNIDNIPLHVSIKGSSCTTACSDKSILHEAIEKDVFGLLDLDDFFCAATEDDDDMELLASIVMEPRPIEAMVESPYNMLA